MEMHFMKEVRSTQEVRTQSGLTQRVAQALEEVLNFGPTTNATESEIRVLQNILSLLRAHLAIVQDEQAVQSSIAAFNANVVQMDNVRLGRPT